jgi:hypothetical protein
VNRFWSKVDKSGECWPWTAGTGTFGYGMYWTDGKTVGAHRVSYELANGALQSGMFVLHSCDNPACVNPRHLSAGTHRDNMRDMVSRGRALSGDRNPMRKGHAHKTSGERNGSHTKPHARPRGMTHGCVKLSDGNAIVVQMLAVERVAKQAEIARAFGISQTHVSSINTGKCRQEIQHDR